MYLEIKEVIVFEFAKSRRIGFAPSPVGKFVPMTSAMYVSLGSGRPKNGPHCFATSFSISGPAPRQRSSRLRHPQVQLLQNSSGGNIPANRTKSFNKQWQRRYLLQQYEPIECVEMNARCFIGLEEFSDEIDGLMDAVVADGFVVVFDGRQNVGDFFGYFQLGNFDDLAQRIVALNGHHTRNNGDVNAQRPTVVNEFDESLRPEEQLCDNKIRTGINLNK